MNDWAPIIVPVIAAVAAILGSWLSVRAGAKKADADAAETFTDIALKMVQPLQEEIDALKKDVKYLKRENKMLHRWSQLLFAQVVEHGGEPIPFSFVEDGDDK